MSRAQRVRSILTGLIMIFGCVMLVIKPDDGYVLVAAALSISLFVMGVRHLIYYFSMARHMVGGRTLLYKAVILIDLGAFAMSLTNYPRYYVIFYLIGAHAFSGVVDILHALEARDMQDPKWKRQLIEGTVNLLVALGTGVVGIAFHSTDLVVYIYCVCLLYTAVMKIASAFKRTAIIYIQ